MAPLTRAQHDRFMQSSDPKNSVFRTKTAFSKYLKNKNDKSSPTTGNYNLLSSLKKSDEKKLTSFSTGIKILT